MASASPRRQAALRALGLDFEIVASDAEAHLPLQLDPTDPRPAARAKAADVSAQHPGALVLAGDTIVALESDALGKPGAPERAAAMLARLRGKSHAVHTAVALRSPSGLEDSLVIAPLTMRAYSDAEIADYVRAGEALDCAGAYDVHRQGAALVESVAGCFSAVVGLPIAEACRLLSRAGITPGADPAAVCSALYGRRCLAADPLTRARCHPE
ncbi:MAG: Maf family protein [Chloroflexota bacterium]